MDHLFLILNTKEGKECLHIIKGNVVIYKKITRPPFNFYFEIRIDSQGVTKRVHRDPMYLLSLFPNDCIFHNYNGASTPEN